MNIKVLIQNYLFFQSIVQIINLITIFIHSFIQRRGCAEVPSVFCPRQISTRGKWLTMFQNWYKLLKNMFFCSCPRKFKCNYFDFCFTARSYINYLDIRKSVFLITKNFIHQKSEKVSTGEYVFLLLIRKMMKCSEKCAISKACPFSSPISVFVWFVHIPKDG